MLIRCPECHFDRHIEDTKIPPSAVMATCPRCQCRFRFRNEDGSPLVPEDTPSTDGESNVMAEEKPSVHSQPELSNLEEDDPLPPGAVIPNIPSLSSDHPEESSGQRSETFLRKEQKKDSSSEKTETAPTQDEKKEEERASSEQESSSAPLRKKNSSSFLDKFQKTRQKLAGNRDKFSSQSQHEIDQLVPWEHPRRYGNLAGLYHTILRVMFTAPRFFASLAHTNGGLGRPLVFYLVLGVFQTLVERMWYLMSIQANGPSITDPKMQEMLGNMAQSMSLSLTLLLSPVILALQLCFFASVFFLMLRLVQPDNAHFRTVFRVIAYSAAPTIVCIIPLIGPLVGSIWFGSCCFIGCKYALRLPWSRTALALAPLYFIAFAIGVQVIRQIMALG